LQPPIDKEGGYLPVLMRVAQGKVVPPEQRAPQRARAGRIPRELAAVAMKALAKDPRDRYPSVEDLRKDIERFREGRSVSAKDDTAWETFKKLVKRNKGVSIATATALLVIAVLGGLSIKLINDGRLQAEEAYAAYRQEQEAKRLQAKEAVPVVLEAARFALERRRFPEAAIQARLAVDYDSAHAGARLFRAKVLIAEKDFPAARAELEKFLDLRPGDADGTRLLELCGKARAEDSRSFAAFADAFLSQNELVLAAHMVSTREGQLAVYRQRIDDAWPKAKVGTALKMNKEGNCTLEIHTPRQITDLEPLRGIPLVRLTVEGCANLRDLAALSNLPLTQLELSGCPQVTDLTALRGLVLTSLSLHSLGPIKSLSPLQGMRLTGINLNIPVPPKELDVLRGMPLTHLTNERQDMRELMLSRDFPQLTELRLHTCWNWETRDLEGLKLKKLGLINMMAVRDLAPLAGMPLEHLEFDGCSQLSDLTPLSKIPTLKWLSLSRCPEVKVLSPLTGLKLETIVLNHEKKYLEQELKVLRQMESLKVIEFWPWRGPAAQFWKKYDAGEFRK
jgi:hypothetical protein